MNNTDLDGRVIIIKGTAKEYRLRLIQSEFCHKEFEKLLEKLKRSYNHEPYDYGNSMSEIYQYLKRSKKLKSKTKFGHIFEVKDQSNIYRIEKSTGKPNKKRLQTLETAYKNLRSYYLHKE